MNYTQHLMHRMVQKIHDQLVLELQKKSTSNEQAPIEQAIITKIVDTNKEIFGLKLDQFTESDVVDWDAYVARILEMVADNISALSVQLAKDCKKYPDRAERYRTHDSLSAVYTKSLNSTLALLREEPFVQLMSMDEEAVLTHVELPKLMDIAVTYQLDKEVEDFFEQTFKKKAFQTKVQPVFESKKNALSLAINDWCQVKEKLGDYDGYPRIITGTLTVLIAKEKQIQSSQGNSMFGIGGKYIASFGGSLGVKLASFAEAFINQQPNQLSEDSVHIAYPQITTV